MNRRHYLLTLGAVSAIAGCNESSSEPPDGSGNGDGDNSEPEAEPEREAPNGESDTVPASDPGEILDIEIASVAGSETSVEIGEELQINVIVTLPVTDGLYDARVEATLLDESDDVFESETVELGDVADDESEPSHTVETPMWIPTSELTEGTYRVRVEVEDYPSGETVTSERTIEIVEPIGEERAAVEAHIEAAREMIWEGVETFKSRGNGSLTGITAEDTDVSMKDISGPTIPAEGEIREARGYELDEYTAELDRLEVEQQLVRDFVYAQRHAFEVVEDFRDILDLFADEDRAVDELEAYSEEVTNFDRRIFSHSPGVAEMVSEATDGEHEATDYDSKIEQFSAEIEAFERFGEIAEVTQSPLWDLYRARQMLDRENYTEAELYADDAEFKFTNVQDDLSALDRLPNTVERFDRVVDELAVVSREVRREAIAEADD